MFWVLLRLRKLLFGHRSAFGCSKHAPPHLRASKGQAIERPEWRLFKIEHVGYGDLHNLRVLQF
jgi:hypothetical protein